MTAFSLDCCINPKSDIRFWSRIDANTKIKDCVKHRTSSGRSHLVAQDQLVCLISEIRTQFLTATNRHLTVRTLRHPHIFSLEVRAACKRWLNNTQLKKCNRLLKDDLFYPYRSIPKSSNASQTKCQTSRVIRCHPFGCFRDDLFGYTEFDLIWHEADATKCKTEEHVSGVWDLQTNCLPNPIFSFSRPKIVWSGFQTSLS